MNGKTLSEIEKLKLRIPNISEREAKECNEILDNCIIGAISVGELLDRNFSYQVPDFQRGYRWTEHEVTTLIDDVMNAKNSTHCLQPLVLMKDDIILKLPSGHGEYTSISDINQKRYKIIDGQQRLTTIVIFLKWLSKKRHSSQGKEIKLPEIEYATRAGSKEYIKSITNKEDLSNLSIDEYNMQNAYNTLNKISEQRNINIDEFEKNLLDNCYFILYIADKTEKEYDIFTRLNSGKIPLSNAELTKALLLSNQEGKKRLERAAKWDEMTKFFENDNFWYFICTSPENDNYMQTRLDYLLDLACKVDIKTKKNKYETFELISKSNLEERWNTIVKYYETLKFWYLDVPCSCTKGLSFYHLIGYRIITDENLNLSNLLEDFNSEKKKKSDFRNSCVDYILKSLGLQPKNNEAIITQENLNALKYGPDNKLISKYLLLMNIAALEFNTGAESRYPFAAHKREKWSLEHIHARNENPDSNTVEEYRKIKHEREQKVSESAWRNIESDEDYDDVMNYFERCHEYYIFEYNTSFGNLALLPRNVNSAVNNGTYMEKRDFIAREIMKKGEIIPICTRNAFFKVYSPNDANNVIWDANNAYDYTNAAVELISNYIKHNYEKTIK